MAGNTGKSYRKGAIANSSQVVNPKTKQYIKRDSKTGKFLSSKSSPYKGVTSENKKKNNCMKK